MSWSNHWNQPPPGAPNHASMPFWDFINALDPNNSGRRAPGAGVDHAGPSGPAPPWAAAGFPFSWGNMTGFGGPEFDFHAGRSPGGPFRFRGGFGPWGGRGGRGHGGRCHRGRCGSDDETDNEAAREAQGAAAADNADNEQGEKEKDDSPETVREKPDGPPESDPEHGPHHPPPHGHHGHHHGPHGRHWHGPGGRRGGRRHGPPHGPPHGPAAPPPPPYPGAHPPPPAAGGFPFDFAELARGLAGHPFAQAIRNHAEQLRAAAQQARGGVNNNANNNGNDDGDDVDVFVPPVDVFNTERAFILHVALPGAKKEDVGVNWDADKSTLNVAGVVYRPGDEEFLQSLSSAERRVGMFERSVTLPPPGSADERDEVDELGITARMEDGVLIVTVPKVEKEWTEVRKVDIE